MKSKVFLFAAILLFAAGANAQKGIDIGTPYGSGADSIRCLTNLNLFGPEAKAGNYENAYPYWKMAYEECPGSNRNIYLYGVNIINWLIEKETDAAKKDAHFDELMKLYDNRVKYFGNDPTYSKDWIIGKKAEAYNQYKGDNSDYTLMYKWLGDILDEFKEKTDGNAIAYYMFASLKLVVSDIEKYKTQYIEDFIKCSALLDTQIAAAKSANNEKDANNLIIRKSEIEKNFGGSGAADCNVLQSVYAPKVEERKTDLNFLKETMTLLRRIDGCNESDLFLTIAEYVYNITPTAESAMGLGTKAYNNKDYATAEKYYNEAIGMTEDSDIKADLYYYIAAMAYSQSQYQKVKQLCQRSIAEKSNIGKAYFLIAQAYAAGYKNIFPDDPVRTKCVFIAVIDKLEKARQVDPSLSGDVSKQITKYREYLPTNEEIFMHPELDFEKPLVIGGWINETVILPAQKRKN